MAAVTTGSVIVSPGTATALDVVPAVAKTKIAVYGFVIVAGAASAQTLIWQSKTTPTPHFGPVELPRVIGESINVMSPSTDISAVRDAPRRGAPDQAVGRYRGRGAR